MEETLDRDFGRVFAFETALLELSLFADFTDVLEALSPVERLDELVAVLCPLAPATPKDDEVLSDAGEDE